MLETESPLHNSVNVRQLLVVSDKPDYPDHPDPPDHQDHPDHRDHPVNQDHLGCTQNTVRLRSLTSPHGQNNFWPVPNQTNFVRCQTKPICVRTLPPNPSDPSQGIVLSESGFWSGRQVPVVHFPRLQARL